MTQTALALQNESRAAIAEALNQALADTTSATMMAQTFHWNVTGMAFGPLHDLFQQIYEDHFAAQDDLAERVKALSAHAGGTPSELLKRSAVAEHDGRAPAEEMIKAMQTAQETLAATLASAGALAADHEDPLTEDLCIARGQTHEKFAWLLRAHLV